MDITLKKQKNYGVLVGSALNLLKSCNAKVEILSFAEALLT